MTITIERRTYGEISANHWGGGDTIKTAEIKTGGVEYWTAIHEETRSTACWGKRFSSEKACQSWVVFHAYRDAEDHGVSIETDNDGVMIGDESSGHWGVFDHDSVIAASRDWDAYVESGDANDYSEWAGKLIEVTL